MNNLEVSLVKYLCPVCGKDAEEGIIMNSLLTEKNAKAVKEMNGQAIGYANHVCKECKPYKDKAVFFIGIDSKKSEPNNPYRTGQIVGVKKESPLVEHCKKYIVTIEDGSRLCYMDEEAGKEIGLW